MSFTWIPYYKEFAQRLTQFQKDRKRLLNLIYDNRDELLAKYLHDQGGEGDLLEDIDPFTVFGLFNRGIKHENRINSAKLFKNILDNGLGYKYTSNSTLAFVTTYKNRKRHGESDRKRIFFLRVL